jgi:hypothetical protein
MTEVWHCQIISAALRDRDADMSPCSCDNNATGWVWVFNDTLWAPAGFKDLAVLRGVGVHLSSMVMSEV